MLNLLAVIQVRTTSRNLYQRPMIKVVDAVELMDEEISGGPGATADEAGAPQKMLEEGRLTCPEFLNMLLDLMVDRWVRQV